MKLILATALAVSVAVPATAQQNNCAPTEGMTQYMAEKYGEGVTGYGIDAKGRVVSIFVNADTGTWTAVMSFPNGQSCLVAGGTDWQQVDGALPPQGDPA